MENNYQSIEDIRTIRRIMEESSRFLSLSGLSGIVAGLLAIAGALAAHFFIIGNHGFRYDEYFSSLTAPEQHTTTLRLCSDALVVLTLAIIFALYFSWQKAKKDGRKIWSPVSKRLLLSLVLPLAAGGALIIIMIFRGYAGLAVPAMLIFYGLALVSAGKFTYGEIFYLGVLELIIGLVSAAFPGYDLLFWILGFGILHIIYGLFMYRKYEA
jgi:hypothetical protein